MTYKKRAKAGWNTDKDSSNRKERTFEKELIEKEVESQEIGDSKTVEPEDKFVSSGQRIGKKKYKYPEEREIKKIEKKISYAKRWLERNDKYGFSGTEWMIRTNMKYKTELEKLEPKLEKLQKKLEEKKRNE